MSEQELLSDRRRARATVSGRGGDAAAGAGSRLRPCTVLALLALAAAGCAGTRARSGSSDDAAEIARLPVAFAWAVDAKQIDPLMALMSEGVVYDLSAYGFPPTTGQEAVRQLFLTGVLPFVRCSTMLVSNFRVEISGDRATGADYFVHTGYDPRGAPPGTRTHTEGRHFYEFVREGGAWRIARIRGEPHFERRERYAPAELRTCRG